MFFLKAVAASEKGFGGCEIWINTSNLIGTHAGINQKVVYDNVTILLAKPRRLVCILRASCCELVAICLHAPDSTWPHQETDDRWLETSEDLSQCIPIGCTILCGADLNMRIRKS